MAAYKRGCGAWRVVSRSAWKKTIEFRLPRCCCIGHSSHLWAASVAKLLSWYEKAGQPSRTRGRVRRCRRGPHSGCGARL